jgi:hypothetical protein
MQEQTNTQEIKERLELIENMLSAGRRKTENWGWTFVLWGVAYYVAIVWAAWSKAGIAWAVTMITAAILTAAIASRKRTREPETTIGCAIGSIWMSLGISMFVLFMAMGLSHRIEQHVFVAIIGAMLGMANGISGLILKWKMQLACAIVWWVAAAAACFGDNNQSSIVFLVAIFLCQIVFGIYAMIRGSQRRHEAIHA